MVKVRKLFSCAFLVTVMIFGFMLFNSIPFGVAQDSTEEADEFAEAPIMRWSRTYPPAARYTIEGYGVEYSEGFCVIQATDEGYLIAGHRDGGYHAKRVEPHVYASVFIRTDSSGKRQWETDSSEIDYPYSVSQALDSGFILSSLSGISKIDDDGNIEWTKYYMTQGDEQTALKSIIQTRDENYVTVGHEYYHYAVVNKVNVNGTLLWQKIFTDNSTGAVAYDVVEADDGGYIIAGSADSAESLWILKTDENGTVQLERKYDIKTIEDPLLSIHYIDIDKTHDGGYIISCDTVDGDTSFACLAKVDSQFNLQWNRNYGYRGFRSVIQVANGGYLAVGQNHTSVLLVRTDELGNLLWTKTYGKGYASSVIATADGEYAVVGMLDDEIWFAKFALETIDLTVYTPSPILLAAVVSVVIVVAAGLVIYIRKRKPYAKQTD